MSSLRGRWVGRSSMWCHRVNTSIARHFFHREASAAVRNVRPALPSHQTLVQGSCLQHHVAGDRARNAVPGRRGIITEMSGSSRRRFMMLFAILDWEAIAAAETPILFLTLTTPPKYWNQQAFVYQALRRFQDALDYYHGGPVCALVRKERGRRNGMLHYHPVTFGVRDSPAFRKWLRETWARCLESETVIRVHVEAVRSPQDVCRYLAKYVAKAGHEGRERPEGLAEAFVVDAEGVCTDVPVAFPESPAVGSGDPEAPQAPSLSNNHKWGNGGKGGRWWYIWGKDLLPWAVGERDFGEDGRRMAVSVRRIFRKWRLIKLREAMVKAGQVVGLTFSERDIRRELDKFKKTPFWFSLVGAKGFTLFISPGLLARMAGNAWANIVPF